MKNSTHISKKATNFPRNIVYLKKRFENFGSEEILDANGRQIGTVIIPFLHLNKNLEVKDLSTNKVIVLEKTNKIFSEIYLLKKTNGKLVAIVKKKRFSIYTSKILLNSSLKLYQYMGIGNFETYNYNIINNVNKKVIAIVNNVDGKKNLPKNIKSNPNNYYCLNFANVNINKFIIINFTLCINLLYSPCLGVSDLAGFERKVARLRPFGPGRNLN